LQTRSEHLAKQQRKKENCKQILQRLSSQGGYNKGKGPSRKAKKESKVRAVPPVRGQPLSKATKVRVGIEGVGVSGRQTAGEGNRGGISNTKKLECQVTAAGWSKGVYAKKRIGRL